MAVAFDGAMGGMLLLCHRLNVPGLLSGPSNGPDASVGFCLPTRCIRCRSRHWDSCEFPQETHKEIFLLLPLRAALFGSFVDDVITHRKLI